MDEDRKTFDLDWAFMTEREQRAYLVECARLGESPPAGTLARDVHDRADALARAVVAHKTLRLALANETRARREAEQLMAQARERMAAADAVNARADALVDVLVGDRA